MISQRLEARASAIAIIVLAYDAIAFLAVDIGALKLCSNLERVFSFVLIERGLKLVVDAGEGFA